MNAFKFLKVRDLGTIISDFITLVKLTFKHFNNISLRAFLPIVALLICVSFLITNVFYRFYVNVTYLPSGGELPELMPILGIMGLGFIYMILFIFLYYFVIEYVILLREKDELTFTFKDVRNSLKANRKKYIKHFFASLLVTLIAMIPLGIIFVILAFIPIIGTFANMFVQAALIIFIYYSMMAYREDRTDLWGSFSEGWKLLKKQFFMQLLAKTILGFLTNIVLSIVTILPAIVIFLIFMFINNFDTELFFESFTGRFLISIGMSLLTIYMLYAQLFNAQQLFLMYNSAIERDYQEGTLSDIETLGTTQDEF